MMYPFGTAIAHEHSSGRALAGIATAAFAVMCIAANSTVAQDTSNIDYSNLSNVISVVIPPSSPTVNTGSLAMTPAAAAFCANIACSGVNVDVFATDYSLVEAAGGPTGDYAPLGVDPKTPTGVGPTRRNLTEPELGFLSKITVDSNHINGGKPGPYATYTLDLYGDGLVQFSIDEDTYTEIVGEMEEMPEASVSDPAGIWVWLSEELKGRLIGNSMNLSHALQANAAEVADDGSIVLSVESSPPPSGDILVSEIRGSEDGGPQD